jgi:hypothetical protein
MSIDISMHVAIQLNTVYSEKQTALQLDEQLFDQQYVTKDRIE